jgi:hypothetical protein
MHQGLLIAGLAVSVGPVRRTVVRPVAKAAIRGALTVADAAGGTVKGLGDVVSEARAEHRASSNGRPATATAKS